LLLSAALSTSKRLSLLGKFIRLLGLTVLDVAQVLSLMWLRTTVNYQVQYATYNTAFPSTQQSICWLCACSLRHGNWLTSYRQYLSWHNADCTRLKQVTQRMRAVSVRHDHNERAEDALPRGGRAALLPRPRTRADTGAAARYLLWSTTEAPEPLSVTDQHVKPCVAP